MCDREKRERKKTSVSVNTYHWGDLRYVPAVESPLAFCPRFTRWGFSGAVGLVLNKRSQEECAHSPSEARGGGGSELWVWGSETNPLLGSTLSSTPLRAARQLFSNTSAESGFVSYQALPPVCAPTNPRSTACRLMLALLSL